MREARAAAVAVVATVVVMMLVAPSGRDSSLLRPAAAEGLQFNANMNAYVTSWDDGLIVWHLQGDRVGRATQYFIGKAAVAKLVKPEQPGQPAVYETQMEPFLFSEEFRPVPNRTVLRSAPMRLGAHGAAEPAPPPPMPAPAAPPSSGSEKKPGGAGLGCG